MIDISVGSQQPARLAQSVEHETLNLRVVGSSPTLGAYFFCKQSSDQLMLGMDNLLENKHPGAVA